MALHLLVVLLNLITLRYHGAEGRTVSMNEKMAMAGTQPVIVADEFDCVDLHKQHAFSHPALKDHKLQLEPGFKSKVEEEEVSSTRTSSLISFDGPGCPVGMVPVQRVKQLQNDSFHRLTKNYPGQHFGVVRNKQKMVGHGGGGIMNIWDLPLQDFQVSAAQIWVRNGPPSHLNTIQVGWEVNPTLYHDSYAHLTTFWTSDNYGKTGCYNTICPGFVQVFSKPILGARLQSSVYRGKQYVLDIMVEQDGSTGNWWLIVEGQIRVGYWPKELFNYLREGASVVEYGGWTVNIPNSDGPPMGNGYWGGKSLNESAFIAQMKIVNEDHMEVPPDFKAMEIFNSDSVCYIVYYNGFVNQTLGHCMFYGGPGGPCNLR